MPLHVRVEGPVHHLPLAFAKFLKDFIVGDSLANHFSKLTSFESAGMDACALLVGPSGSAHDLCRESGKVSQPEWYAKKVTDTRGKIKCSCAEGESLSSDYLSPC